MTEENIIEEDTEINLDEIDLDEARQNARAQLETLATKVAEKREFIDKMGLAPPHDLTMISLRVEFILAKITEIIPDGDLWRAALEVDWLASYINLLDQIIYGATPEDRRKGLHVVGGKTNDKRTEDPPEDPTAA